MKKINSFIQKFYRVEYYSGEMDCNTLKDAEEKVLYYREKPHWAFSDGSAKIFPMEKEVIIRKGKCIKSIKPKRLSSKTEKKIQ